MPKMELTNITKAMTAARRRKMFDSTHKQRSLRERCLEAEKKALKKAQKAADDYRKKHDWRDYHSRDCHKISEKHWKDAEYFSRKAEKYLICAICHREYEQKSREAQYCSVRCTDLANGLPERRSPIPDTCTNMGQWLDEVGPYFR